VWGLPGRDLAPDEPAAWGLAAVAAAAAFAVNESTVALAIALARREPVRPVLLNSLRVSALLWAGNVAIGLLAIVAWSGHPIGLVLVAVPLGLLYLAYRDWVAGLVEREQMQDLAQTAERIARDRDPSARLPLAGREGRLGQLAASLNRMLEQVDRAVGRDRHLMREAAQELHAPVRALRRELAVPAEPVDGEPCAQHRMRAEVDRIARVLDEMDAVAGAGRPGSVLPRPVALRPFLDGVARRAEPQLTGRLTRASGASRSPTRAAVWRPATRTPCSSPSTA
jgi:signal transduction histidine kinase